MVNDQAPILNSGKKEITLHIEVSIQRSLLNADENSVITVSVIAQLKFSVLVYTYTFFFFLKVFIYLFIYLIYGCVGSSFLCEGFL